MTFIRESVDDDIRTRIDSLHIEPVHDLGYADDWLLMATTMPKLQDKALMASAGAAMLGLTTSPKSEAFLLDYSHSIREPMEPLRMWDHNWEEFQLPFNDKESFKYLGAVIQRSGTSRAQHKALLPPLRSLTRYICTRRASPESMLIALKAALVPKILYPLKFTCESSTVLKDISRILCSAYRKVSRNMPSFPTALLLLPRRLGGLGLPDIELLVFQAKLSMFYRMRSRNDSAAIASALFYRRARSIGWDPVPGQYFAFPEDELIGPDCWIDTLIRFTRQCESSITIGGTEECTIWDTPLREAVPGHSHHFISRSLSRLVDILDEDGELRYVLPTDLATRFHERHRTRDEIKVYHLRTEQFFGFPSTDSPNTYRVIQIYGCCVSNGDLFFEYVDWDRINFDTPVDRRWLVHTNWPRRYLIMRYSRLDWMGAKLLLTSPERIVTRQGLSLIRREIALAKEIAEPSIEPYSTRPLLPRGYSVGHVYSDGSLATILPLSSAFTFEGI